MMSDEHRDEFPIPADYQEYLPGDRVFRKYDENAHVTSTGSCNLNPLLSHKARSAFPARIRKVILGASKSTAQIFVRLAGADAEGTAISGVDSTMQFNLREQIESLGVPIPKGKIALLPCQVVQSKLGPMLVLDCRKPDYENVPPRAPRKKKGTSEDGKAGDGKAAPGQAPQT